MSKKIAVLCFSAFLLSCQSAFDPPSAPTPPTTPTPTPTPTCECNCFPGCPTGTWCVQNGCSCACK